MKLLKKQTEKTFITELLRNKFLLGNFNFVSVYLSCKSKIFFFWWNWWTMSFNILGVVSNLESNSGGGKGIHKSVCK